MPQETYRNIVTALLPVVRTYGKNVRFDRPATATEQIAEGVTRTNAEGSAAITYNIKAMELQQRNTSGDDMKIQQSLKLLIVGNRYRPSLGDVATVEDTCYTVSEVERIAPGPTVVGYVLDLVN